MAETGDATVMARNVKRPLSLDDMPELLRKLQGSIHFEKTLTASSASGYLGQHCRLALPCSFIKRHGDKLRKSVILRTDSSTNARPATTHIVFMSPGSTQVKFSGGWRAFADSNGLLEGDSLIFSLTAMSEFEVYVFRSIWSPPEIPSQVKRDCNPDSNISMKTAAKKFYERRNEQLSAGESAEGAMKSSGLLVAKKEIVAEELETEDSKPKNVIDSSSRDRHDSKNGQEPALNRDELMVPGSRGGRKIPDTEYRSPRRSEVLRKLQGSIHFEKTLTASSASGYLGRECKLALPFSFVRRYGDKFRKTATLRTESSTKAWPVSIGTHLISPACTQFRFIGGWRAFVDFNCLMEGDSLIFSLTAISEFEVYVFPGSTGNPKKLPSQLVRRRWSNGAGLPRKKAKQSHERKNEQLSAEDRTEGTVKSSGLLVAKKEIVLEELAIKDSKPKTLIHSSSRHYDDSKNGRESALEGDEITVPGTSGGRKNPNPDCQSPTRSEVLRRLQGSLHFEKRVTAFGASDYLGRSPGLEVTLGVLTKSIQLDQVLTDYGVIQQDQGLPFWFVQSHGDKFRKSVILRSESSTKPWSVTLSVESRSLESTQVKFCRGWKPFAAFHGLMEGDWLIFSLIAISEFEVHIFPGTGNPKEFPSQLVPTKWSNDSAFSRKKAKQAYECKNEKLSAEETIGGAVKFNGWIAQKRTTGGQHPVSAFDDSPSSLRNSSSVKDSKLKKVTDSSSRGHNNGQEPAHEYDKLKESGASGGRKNPGDDYRGPTLQNISRNFQLPGFYKKLEASNICHDEKGEKPAYMEIPLDFWKTYSRRLHSVVKLQGIREESEVKTVVCCPSYGKQTRIYLRAGWGDFANENNLEVVQELLFTLTADSYFAVREVLPPP